jgi:GNAT superfamily N-acetyltransferase
MDIFTMNSQHEKWDMTAEYAKKCSWSAGRYLSELMHNRMFKEWERVFAAYGNYSIAGFCTLTEKDELSPEYPYSPLIGFVFTDEEYRGNRLSEKMIRKAIDYAGSIGYEKVYIMSGETGLYEKYGFRYIENFKTIYGGTEQLFYINTHNKKGEE